MRNHTFSEHFSWEICQDNTPFEVRSNNKTNKYLDSRSKRFKQRQEQQIYLYDLEPQVDSLSKMKKKKVIYLKMWLWKFCRSLAAGYSKRHLMEISHPFSCIRNILPVERGKLRHLKIICLIISSERPKPLFWFRSDTETLIGRYFRPIP
jgi:hypothetical protein